MRFKKFLKCFNHITKNTINDIKKNCNKMLNKKKLNKKILNIKELNINELNKKLNKK